MEYSIINSAYSSNGLIDQYALTENLAKSFYASDYSIDQLDEYASLTCEGNLLLEFNLKDFVKDNLVNVLQAGIGYALETGISVGTIGVGAPVAVAAEMINDMIFFGYSAGDAINSIKSLFSKLGEMKAAVKEMFSSTVKNAPQAIYEKVQSVINQLRAFFEYINIDLTEGIEKLKELYRKLMVKMAKVAGDLIALFSPIPGTDMLVQNAIVEFSDDAYKLLLSAFNQLPDFVTRYVNDPGLLKDDVFGIIDSCVGFIKGYLDFDKNDKEEKKSWLGSVVSTIKTGAEIVTSPLKSILKYSGAGEKVLEWLNGSAKSLLTAAIKTYEKIYPIMISTASAIEILISDDHNLFDDEDYDEENDEENDEDIEEGFVTNKNNLREEIGINFQTRNNDPYSWKDDPNIDVEMYVNNDGTWQAKVISMTNPSWSTPFQTFKDQFTAAAWTEKCVDILTRKHLNV